MADPKQPNLSAGLDKFLEGSHTQMRLYHGTTATEGGKGSEAIRTIKASKDGALGSGVYLTPDPEFAGEYAKQSGGNVLPVHARIMNPLVIHNKRGEDPMRLALVKLGVHPDKAAKMVEKAYEQEGYIGKQVQSRAQTAGHDALMQYRDGVLTEVVHYNPSMIKSATGNSGDYDTTKPSLNMAEGGSVDSPTKTVKAYKLFRVHPKHPGKLFPLFVDSNTPVEMNKWVDAKEGEMAQGKVKSKIGPLAYRPGWHAGDLPVATHIGEKSDPELTAPDRRPAHHAWAEVEMPDDVDWQAEATRRGTNEKGRVVPVKAHITDQLPVGGHYRYKTNPNMTGNWLIGGSMKVNKVLSDDEVSSINKAAGAADLPRDQPFKKKEFGFAAGGSVAPEEWQAEEHVNHKAKATKVHMATGGDVASLDEMKLALTRHGMYSPLEKAAHAVPRTKGTGAEFMTEASKQAGFRPDEVTDRKLVLTEGKMNKQDFLNQIKSTSMPKLVEHTLSEMGEEGEQPQYEEYQLPGGKNYRELLLQVANSKEDPYQSSHWQDVPNVLAHMRLSDRTGPEGEKLLHLEELQSDWHQQGRKMGYAPEGGGLHEAAKQAARRHSQLQHKLHEARLNSDAVELRVKASTTDEQRAMHQRLMDKYNEDVMDLMPKTMKAEDEALQAKIRASSSVPDAPFKKNWHELGMKHVLQHAAKNGYSGVLITPGEEQAKRWQDEGLKVHYDQKIPEYLNKFGKQFGAKVGQAPVNVGGYKVNQDRQDMPYRVESETSPDILSRHATPEDAWEQADKLGTVQLHHFPITEPMRQQILTQGLPMYRSGGIIRQA